MGRRYTGGLLWVLSAVILPVQVVVALRWPRGYSIAANAISDLGVTTCGMFDENGEQARWVCSPWSFAFNSATVASGVLVAAGAALLHGWWSGRAGTAGTVLLVVAGLLVVVVGLTPWDMWPDLHDLAVLGQAIAQWLAMGLLAFAAGVGTFRRVTVGVLVLSVVSFAIFVAALDGLRVPLLGFGGVERLSFDTLVLWTTGVGVAVLARRRTHARSKTT